MALSNRLSNARRTAIYTWIIITIAAVSLIVTAVLSTLGYMSRIDGIAQSNRLIQQFSTDMQAVSDTQGERTDRLINQFSAQLQVLGAAQDEQIQRLITEFQGQLSNQSATDREAFLKALREAIKQAQSKMPPAPPPAKPDTAN